MKLWRLCRKPHVALDGAGANLLGGRYSSPGHPVVSLANEAGLAVLVTLRYLMPDWLDAGNDYLLGWTTVESEPVRIPDTLTRSAITEYVNNWLESRHTLLAAIKSAVLPEADVILLNPLHPAAAQVSPLVTRPFCFAECLHKPPMLDIYRDNPASKAG